MKFTALVLLSSLAMVGCGSNGGNNGPAKPAPGAFEKSVTPSCKNSIAVDDLGARSSELKAARKGRYALVSIEMYLLSSKGDSLRARANEYTNFKVQLDCNGVSADADLRGSLSGGTEINTATMANAATSRQMNVSVKAGQLEEAITELLRNDSTDTLDFDKVPKGRFQSGDAFLTVNIKPAGDGQINIDIKMESADIIEYGSMVYRFR